MEVIISGMQLSTSYNVSLEINPFKDNSRYKYSSTEWVKVGKADSISYNMLTYLHPNSPATGKFWMTYKVSFETLKITNNENKREDSVSVLM